MPTSKHTKRQLTQYDIARELGISQTTVSQVLGNRPSATIPPETRERILAAAKALGYVPNRIARSLRTGKTQVIAAVIPDITNPFYPALVRGIQDIAEAHAYHVATYNTDGRPDKERQILALVQQVRADGLIVAPFHHDRDALRPLLERGVPIVLLDEPAPENDIELPLDTIGTDTLASAQAAVSYLIARGHQRIAMLSSRLAHAGVARADGYRRTLADHGLPFDERLLIWCDDFTESSGYHGLHQLWRVAALPSAVFAASDQLALGALRAIKELGIDVPDRLALIGVDDISAARLVSPPLTTIAQPQAQMGRQAATMLFERLNQEYAGVSRHVSVPFTLIERQSA